MKRNLPIIGFIIGAVLPLAGMAIVYFILFREVPFDRFLTYMKHDHRIAAKVLTLSILINLLPFLYFTRRRLDYTARGVLVATILYAVFIILLRFVW